MLPAALNSLRVPRKNLLLGAASTAILVAFFYLLLATGGANTAQAGFIGVMLLIAPMGRLNMRGRIVAGAWAIAVATLGYFIVGTGWVPYVLALSAVCLVQGVFWMGDIAAMTRAPANFVFVAGFVSHKSEVAYSEILIGTAAAVVFMLCIGALMAAGKAEELKSSSLGVRLRYGLMLALGCLAIVGIAKAVYFPYASWAVLSLCLILSVDSADRSTRMKNRIFGTIGGAVLATGVSLLPAPVPQITLLICAILCIAYIRSGEYTLFVTFLTPVILLSSTSEAATHILAAERIGAIVVSVVIALICTYLAELLGKVTSPRLSAGS